MIIFFNVWVAISLGLYYFGPIEWPGRSGPEVALYVLLCVACFDFGYYFSRRTPSVPPNVTIVPQTRVGARVVVTCHAVVTFIYLAAITGRSVLSLSAYSLNFGDVYAAYGRSIASLNASMGIQIVTLLKACLFPLALVIFISRFRTDKLIVGLFLGPMLISSLFRGTDREVIDVLILLLVAALLHRLVSSRVAAILGLVPVALAVFLIRRMERFGGDLPACLPDSGVCFNYESQVAKIFGDRVEALFVFITNYLTNGYQGLAYAFRLHWQPNWGLGQWPPLKRTACSGLHIGCSLGDYQQSLTSAGWNASARWTTAYTVLANDFSFWLVPVWVLVLGIAFARCLAMWRGSRDPVAGAAIVIVTIFWVYSSANMQVAISLDWAVATAVLLYVAPWRRMTTALPPLVAAPRPAKRWPAKGQPGGSRKPKPRRRAAPTSR